MRRIVPVLWALLLAPFVPWTQARLDRSADAATPHEEVLYLWSGAHVKRLLPGLEAVAADVYWLRTVQYLGSERVFSKRRGFELLQPLIEITVTLDPRLEIAYRYGAIFLCESPPHGAGRPQAAIALLKKGTENLPRSWRMRQDYGFYQFVCLGDAQAAAATLNQAADMPGAAFWLRTLAADLLAQGGRRSQARRMWQLMYEQAEEGIIRENARARLMIYDSLEAAERLTSLVAEFEKRAGSRPRRLDQLRAAGLWKGPLVDAAGVPFVYDEASGQVEVSKRSPMWRPW